MIRTADVAVVGEGLVGSAVADELARRGLSVVLVAGGRRGAASAASAGMLGWRSEAAAPGAAFEAARRADALWSEWIEALGGPAVVDRVTGGTVWLARPEEAASVESRIGWQAEMGLVTQRLDRDEAARYCGVIADGLVAFRFPDESAVSPTAVLGALERRFAAHGGIRLEGPVTSVREGARDVTVELAGGGRLSAGAVVDAAGAWGIDSEARRGCIRPVRGQVSHLEARLQVVVRTASVYLVPRAAGTLVVGATEEEVGFDAGTTADALAGLERDAAAVLPQLASARRREARAGLRPVSRDGRPLVGRAPGRERLWLASGHGRNGVLLAPLTALALGRALADGEGEAVPAQWRPDRFRL